MSDYLFIQSQDPFTETRSAQQYALATQLRDAGHGVRLLLVQNGVTAARKGARCPHFDQALQSGLEVIADDFSLQQREIANGEIKEPVSVGGIALAIDALLAGHKVIWN
ncbi:MAG TPA: DsrE family protein [Hyphomicrobiales bacterium]|nr:DsrE family protein [Hyphomicrobiales bacterium]